jgi:hypothetical protein
VCRDRIAALMAPSRDVITSTTQECACKNYSERKKVPVGFLGSGNRRD